MSEWNVENCRGGLFLGASRCRACASRTARDVSVSALWAVIEGVNELAMLRNAAEYSPPRRGRGGRDGLIEAGATGAKREPDRAKPQLMVSSAKLFRPKHLAELTTITASPYRARASRPSAASSVASRLLLMPQHSPPLRGGEYPNSTSSQFVHIFADRPYR